MNKYSEALSIIAQGKNISLQSLMSPADVLTMRNTIAALRVPAYRIAVERFNAASSETPVQVDMSPLYTATRELCALLGDVNGAPLHPENMVEFIVAESMRTRWIDLTHEMADAHRLLRDARIAQKDDPSEKNEKEVERLREECKRLEKIPGNCRKNREAVTETVFVKTVTELIGAIINKQQAKSVGQVLAEEAERKAAMKARTKARKAAKAKAAKAAK